MPRFRPRLRAMFDTSLALFLLTVLLQAVAGLLAYRIGRGVEDGSLHDHATDIASVLIFALIEAAALLTVYGSARSIGTKAWTRVVTVALILGAAISLMGAPQMFTDNRWVEYAMLPLVIVLGAFIQIAWGFAPIVAAKEGASGTTALRAASHRMRGHGVAAVLVFLLIGTLDVTSAIAVFVAGGFDGGYDTPVAVLMSLVGGVTSTLWLTWLSSTYRMTEADPILNAEV